jgi:hypothetical protein
VAVGQKKKQFKKTNTTTERVGKRSGASRFDHPAGNRSGKKSGSGDRGQQVASATRRRWALGHGALGRLRQGYRQVYCRYGGVSNIQKEKERDKNSVGNIDICCPTENGGDGGRELEGNHVGGTSPLCLRGFVKKGWAYRQLTAGLKRFNHDDSDPGIRYIPGNGQSTGDKNIMLHSVVSSETSWGRNE